MHNETRLVDIMKQSALGVLKSHGLSTFFVGVVKSISPLEIKIDQKKTIREDQLILTRNVTDYEIEVTVDWQSELEEEQTHFHKIKGKKKILIHNGLKVGDKVILGSLDGGQQYVVIDRGVR